MHSNLLWMLNPHNSAKQKRTHIKLILIHPIDWLEIDGTHHPKFIVIHFISTYDDRDASRDLQNFTNCCWIISHGVRNTLCIYAWCIFSVNFSNIGWVAWIWLEIWINSQSQMQSHSIFNLLFCCAIQSWKLVWNFSVLGARGWSCDIHMYAAILI